MTLSGASMLFLNAPAGITFGIDYNSWTTGPKFKGLSGIPPGLHFVYYALPSGPRSGFFVFLESEEIDVRVWDAQLEGLLPLDRMDPDQTERLRLAYREFQPCLGPYPLPQEGDTQSTFQLWQSLTDRLSSSLLNRVLARHWTVSAMESSSKFSDVPDPRLSDLSPISTTRLAFTEFDLRRSFPPGSTGPEISKYAMDKSFLLQTLRKQVSDAHLIGEIQLSFLIFILGHVYDGFEQWKGLVQIFCQSQEALSTDPSLFISFIDVLCVQLKECPRDFFQDVISSDNFLRSCLLSLATNSLDTIVSPELTHSLDRLWDIVQERFEWDVVGQVKLQSVEDEEDEYQPVVVEDP